MYDSTFNLIIKDRGQGKTTELIHASEVTGLPIVTKYSLHAKYIEEKAKELGVVIPQPIAITELASNNKDPLYRNGVLIDEAYDIISKALDNYLGTHVVAATLTDKLKENEKFLLTNSK